jgi:hypothetical protein
MLVLQGLTFPKRRDCSSTSDDQLGVWAFGQINSQSLCCLFGLCKFIESSTEQHIFVFLNKLLVSSCFGIKL